MNHLIKKVLPLLTTACVLSLSIGLYYAFWGSPPDYQQGQTVRIMYVHVPAAWLALGIYTFMALSNGMFLIWRHPVAGLMAKAAAPVGTIFTVIALITGSIWGKPMWGTWWVWDARLTSVLVLLFLYFGYLSLVNAFDDRMQALRAAAILNILGLVNIPIIKFSVEWWNTLHQPASLTSFSRIGEPAIHSTMLVPLIWMACGLSFLVMILIAMRFQNELAVQKRRTAQLKAINTYEHHGGA
jgi:heme exporter protein C